MKVRNLFRFILSVGLLTMLTFLGADIGNPVQVNQLPETVHFDGANGFRQVGNILHLTYLEQEGETFRVIYVRGVEPYNTFSFLEVAQYESKVILGKPVMEVLSDGRVFLFYPRTADNEEQFLSSLYQAEISADGLLISNELFSENIYTHQKIVNRSDDLHLLFANGYQGEATAPMNLFFDKYYTLDGVPGNIRFYGPDVVHGRVHSNTDIWIRQAGGGSNNGWPTFYGLVTTSGMIRSGTAPENYPVEQVFRGGLIEHYPEIDGALTTDLIRMNGIQPFGNIDYDDRIAFVTIDGMNYESYVGVIVEGDIEEYTIYDSYPPYGPVGNPIGVNQITVLDTLWVPGPSGTINSGTSIFVFFELWISGNIAGRQTWGSAGNIYIKDDITYQNTQPGTPPDGGIDGNYPCNNEDILALVSEKSIYVQYGHKNPQDLLRYKPNTEDIFIYAHLIACGDDEPDPFQAGIFSFQYQHPKGSTPAQIWNDQFYSNIDLHLQHYPTSGTNPWPPGLDYPWYNPLWPEPGPIFDVGGVYGTVIPNPHQTETVTGLRGAIKLYGGIASRRAGFVRRSGSPDFDTGIWDLENHLYGMHTGQPSGYAKEYYYDRRLPLMSPPDISTAVFEDAAQEFPLVEYYKKGANENEFQLIFDTQDPYQLYHFCRKMLLSVNNSRVAILADHNIFISDATGTSFQQYFYFDEVTDIDAILLADNKLYFLIGEIINPAHPDEYYIGKLREFDLLTEEWTLIDERTLFSKQQAIVYAHDMIIWVAATEEESITFNIYEPNGQLINEYVWTHNITLPESFSKYHSKLGMEIEGDQVTLTVHNRREGIFDNSGDLFVASGTLDYLHVENPELPIGLQLSHYPNPVYFGKERQEGRVVIRFALPEPSPVKIEVFNIRGQRVKTVIDREFDKGQHQISWDGRDNRNRKVVRGTYFYRIETKETQQTGKMLVLR